MSLLAFEERRRPVMVPALDEVERRLESVDVNSRLVEEEISLEGLLEGRMP